MNYNQFNRVGACPLVNFDKSRKVYNNHDQLLGVTQRLLVVTMKVFLVLALAVASVSAASGGGGDGQEQDCEDLHADG